MSKKVTHDAPKIVAEVAAMQEPPKGRSKINELLGQVDDAFETAEAKGDILREVKAHAAAAISAEQAAFDAVKAEQAGLVTVAEREAADARVALDRLRQQVNERVGAALGVGADPRVSVK